MSFLSAWLRIIGLALLLALPGCSLVQLGYRQLPELAYWWVDGYFDLGEAQSLRLRDDLAALQRWHRRTQLPLYADLLRQLQRQAEGPITPAQACAVYEQLRGHALVLSEQMAPGVVALAVSLSPEQIRHFGQQLDKTQHKWRREWLGLTPDALLDLRLSKLLDSAERFYGRFDSAQQARLREQLARAPFDLALTERERLRRQQDALQTLRELPRDPARLAQARQAMQALFERQLNSPDPAYRQHLATVVRGACDTAALLHQISTPEQRARAIQRLAEHERDLRQLAAAD